MGLGAALSAEPDVSGHLLQRLLADLLPGPSSGCLGRRLRPPSAAAPAWAEGPEPGGSSFLERRPQAYPRPAAPLVDQKGSTNGKAAAEQRGAMFDQEALSVQPFAKAVAERQEAKLRGQALCDELGRIETSRDKRYCDGADACVTSLPKDFGARTGAPFCYKWVYPPCPPAPPCPAPPPCPKGRKKCPSAPPCPPPPPCPQPYEEDLCAGRAGRPYCVPPEFLSKYGGPVEVKCSASGPGARQRGSPTGCWWLADATGGREDLQRLPGPVLASGKQVAGQGWYVDHGPALSDEEADEWILNGVLPLSAPVLGPTGTSVTAAQFLS